MEAILAVMNMTSVVVVEIRPEKIFRPYFYYFLSSVHNCVDCFYICFFNYSSHVWFSYIYITFCVCLCIFRDWYEPRAALMQEEGSVISGLLVGINIIDCNFDLKGDSLDTWVSGKTCFQERSISNNKRFKQQNSFKLLTGCVGD